MTTTDHRTEAARLLAPARLQRAAEDLAASRAEVRALRDTADTLRADIARYYEVLASERTKLAEAKRLGMEAVAIARDSIEFARDTPTDPATSAIVAVGCLNIADRIAAALEAL